MCDAPPYPTRFDENIRPEGGDSLATHPPSGKKIKVLPPSLLLFLLLRAAHAAALAAFFSFATFNSCSRIAGPKPA